MVFKWVKYCITHDYEGGQRDTFERLFGPVELMKRKL